MQTNVFLGGSDPLLSQQSYPDYSKRIDELQQMQQRLAQQQEQAQAQSPIWNEIEAITAELTDREFELISADEDFVSTQQAVMNVLQREYMRIMKPIVESSADGKDALREHLNTIKRLRKKAASEADKSIELFTEYTQKYSDMTYSEFLRMKKGDSHVS